MNGGGIFAWDNYDDNPLDAIGVNTILTQKNATYAPSAEGELVTDAFETFMSNGDNYAYPQVSGVAGEEPMVLVFGEGMFEVTNSDEKIEITIAPKKGASAGDYDRDAFEQVDIISGELKKDDFIYSISIYIVEKGVTSAENAVIHDNDDNEVTSYYNITYGIVDNN